MRRSSGPGGAVGERGQRSPKPFLCLFFICILWLTGSAPGGLGAGAGRAAESGPIPAAVMFPLDQVKRGLRGTGRTVVEGTRIETFEVEVLGVLSGQGPAGDLILVRVFGDVIDRAGGIAAGMSGSPVFVGDRLLGAVSYGFDLADPRVGLVTPIADMAAVLRLAASPGDGPQEGSGAPGKPAPAPPEPGPILPGLPSPVRTPVLASGLGPRALHQLEGLLAGWPVTVVPAGGTSAATPLAAPVALEPGSAFGLQLMRGDIDLTAIGTVTYVGDGLFVGFGHPFIRRGPVDYFATGAVIHRTVEALHSPFKIGAPSGFAGRVTQDRGAGVAGELALPPDSIRFSATVRTAVGDRIRSFETEIVRDPSLIAPLAAIAALEAVDRAIDRVGPGTATARFRLTGDGLPRPIERENLFFSGSDIAAFSLTELMAGLQTFVGNPFQEIRLQAIEMEIAVDSSRQTARIERATPQKAAVNPGEAVPVTISLRPFRKQPETHMLTLNIPNQIAGGDVTVTVRGGSPINLQISPEQVAEELTGDQGGEQAASASGAEAADLSTADSLEKLIDDFSRRERNNDLIAEFYPQTAGGLGADAGLLPGNAKSDGGVELVSRPVEGRSQGSAGAPREGSRATTPPDGEVEPVRASLATPYVIQGNASFTLTIRERQDGGRTAPNPEKSR